MCGREVELKTRGIILGGGVDSMDLLEDDADFADDDLEEAEVEVEDEVDHFVA